MVSNDEIMDMLKIILEKVERLENIKADNVTIGSGTIAIQCGNCSAVSVETAEDVLIQTGGQGAIAIENTDTVAVDVPEANSLHIECGGDIGSGITVKSNNISKVAVECEGDIQGDVHGYSLEKDE